MKLKLKDFNIQQIAESGECFRWNKISENKYMGVILGGVCVVEQNQDEVSFESNLPDEIIKHYFDLSRDYSKVKDFYRNDVVLAKAIKYGEGIRILNQEKFETLISFIISANNNIPRIKKSVEKISEKYGKKIEYMGSTYFAFPTPEELNRATEEELRECGVGFRDKYIKEATKMVLENHIDLEKISGLPTSECKRELIKIKGVGSKVADCVMLFSMGKADAFPVDVWIKRIMENLYIKNESTLKEIEKYSREKFGEYAGIAQQYLFFFAKETIAKK